MELRFFPIILFGREYWNKIINFEYLADLGLIEDEHLNLFQYADTASEAWKIIKLSNYQKSQPRKIQTDLITNVEE